MLRLFFIYILLCGNLFAQDRIVSCFPDSCVSIIIDNCQSSKTKFSKSFLDIAITPDGNLYGIDDGLYKIDYQNGTVLNKGLINDTVLNRNIFGVGLVAIDNHFLLMDQNDSLYKINIQTNSAFPIGQIGHYCAGDFAFYKDTLYMISSSNHLIKIVLTANKNSIVNVFDIGIINTKYYGILGLYTGIKNCNSNSLCLFATEGWDIYTVNTTDASAEYYCTMADTIYGSYGAASTLDFKTETKVNPMIPNVFTPNNDGSNDIYKLISIDDIDSEFSMEIYNRWGEIVLKTNNPLFEWSGRKNNDELNSGTYFYNMTYMNKCKEQISMHGFITLLK